MSDNDFSSNSLLADVFDGLTGLRRLYLHRSGLASLDADIFDGLTYLQWLYLHGNSLASLDEDLFDGLTGLQRLYLHGNGLTSLHEDVFNGLSSLQRLYLDGNDLTSLPEDLFDDLSSLEDLNLDANMLTALIADVFDGLDDSLTDLYLRDNGLTALPEDIFDGLTGLLRLDLSCNALTTLGLDELDPFAGTLKYLDVGANSFTNPPTEAAVNAKLTAVEAFYLTGAPPCLPAFDTGLSALSLSSGTLTPEFVAPGIPGFSGYRADVGSEVSELTITVAPKDPHASIEPADLAETISIYDDDPSTPGLQVSLHNETKVQWQVRAENGAAILLYGVSVYREHPPGSVARLRSLELDGLTLMPEFGGTTHGYGVASPASATQTSVTAIPLDPDATFEYLDSSDAALADADTNTAGQQVDLDVGDTVFKVKVTAEDTTTTQTYTVTVTRAAACTLNEGDIWCGVVDVEDIVSGGSTVGHGFLGTTGDIDGNPDDKDFTVPSNSNEYTITSLLVGAGSNSGNLILRLDNVLTGGDQATLDLGIDGESDPFLLSTAVAVGGGGGYRWSGTGLDWSMETKVTVRLREEDPPTLSVADATGDEGDDKVVFTVTLSKPYYAATRATWTASVESGDTAVAADLGTTKTGTVSIAATATTATFEVPVADDTTDEDDETFTVTLSSPYPTDVVKLATDATAKGTINDDDGTSLPTLSVADDSNTEGNLMVFALHLSEIASEDVTVTCTASFGSGDTASAGDLTFTSANGLIRSSQDSGICAFPTVDDTIDEEDETFTVTMSGVSSNAQLAADPTAKGTILDDDDPVDNCPNDATTTCEVDVGGSVTGTIENDLDSDWFKVELEAGTRYQFDLEGAPSGRGTLPDPVLEIRSAADAIDADDDGGVGLNSRVIYTPTLSGTYYLSARKAGTTTGNYTLSVIVLGANGASEADTDFPETTSTSGRVDVGASVTGTIGADTDADWFRVDLEAGKTYQFDLEGADTGRGTQPDPYVVLVNPSATIELEFDDHGGVGKNARLIYAVDETGTYYVDAGPGNDEQGTYTLSVRDVTPPEDLPADITTTGVVEVDGSAVRGDIYKPVHVKRTGDDDVDGYDFDTDWFAVELEEGQTYRIDMKGQILSSPGLGTPGEPVDPKLTLSLPQINAIYDADGGYLFNTWSSDESDSHHLFRVTFHAHDSGTHYIAASGESHEWGGYELTVIDITPDDGDDTNPPAGGTAQRGLKNLRAVEEKGGVRLTWQPPDGAAVTGYRIERRRAGEQDSGPQRSHGQPGDHHTLVEDTGNTETSYVDESAEQGVEYEYRVTARNESGPGEESDWVRAGPEEEPVWGDGLPGAPRNLTATPGNREVSLSWDPPDDNGNAPATRYRIEWRVDGKDYGTSQWGTSRETTYTTNDQANLANGVKYFFRVKAENGSGNSYGPYGPSSEEVSATPTSGSAVDLGTPVLSDTETLHHGMVQLDWQDIEDAGWYVVQVLTTWKTESGWTCPPREWTSRSTVPARW